MASEEDLKRLKTEKRIATFRIPRTGQEITGKIIEPSTPSLLMTPDGKPVEAWFIEDAHGSQHGFWSGDIEIVGFRQIQEHVEQTLVHLQGNAYESFRRSLVHDMMIGGKYSEARAEQVIDDLVARARKTR